MAKKLSDAAERELVITRVVNAPRELVFEVFTDPRHVDKWWGPNGFRNTTYGMDVRVGGEWKYMMHGPDGKDYENRIVYEEVVRPELLRYSHGDWEREHFKAMTTFEDLGGGKTRVTLRLVFATAAACEEVKKFGAVDGGNQTLARLEAHLARMAGKGQELVITRELKAPVALVYKTMTEAEHLNKWWGPKGMACRVERLEVKPGGEFLYSMKHGENVMWGKWVYREVVPERLLVFTSGFADEKGNFVKCPFPIDFPLEVLNTWTLEARGDKTLVTLHGVPFVTTEAQRQAFAQMQQGMQQGWGGTLDQWEEHLATLAG